MTSVRSASIPSPDEVREDELDPREEAIRLAWIGSGVPKRYLNVPSATKPAGWTYITGPVGSGKTYGACSIIRRYLEDTTYEGAPGFWCVKSAKFATVVDYLEAIKAHYSDPDDYRAEAMRGADLLVLDDLGQEVPTPWAVEQLFLLINDRYNNERKTVLTSQFGMNAIAARLSANGGAEQAEAIASRLMGSCVAYRLTCGDRRIKNAR